MTLQNEQQILPVRIIIAQENGKHILEIRKKITDLNLIKSIISCAYNEYPFAVMPVFTDRLRSINTLIEKGIITKKVNEDNSIEYDFLI